MTQPSKCINALTLYRYIDGQLGEKQVEKIERHLDECPHCLQELTSLVQHTATPLNEEEKKILSSLQRLPIKKRLRDIFPIAPPPAPSSTNTTSPPNREEKADPFQFLKIVWKPALAFCLIVLSLISVNSGIQYYKGTFQIRRAEKLLATHFVMNYQQPGLSGVNRISLLGTTMGSEDDNTFILAKADRHINKALQKNKNSARAQHLLFQILILQQKYHKADSLLQHIESSPMSATVLHDIGTLKFHQKKYELALAYFDKALEQDQSITMAHYNKAITLAAIDKYDLAMDELDVYLEQESDPIKIDAARIIKKNVQSEQEKNP